MVRSLITPDEARDPRFVNAVRQLPGSGLSGEQAQELLDEMRKLKAQGQNGVPQPGMPLGGRPQTPGLSMPQYPQSGNFGSGGPVPGQKRPVTGPGGSGQSEWGPTGLGAWAGKTFKDMLTPAGGYTPPKLDIPIGNLGPQAGAPQPQGSPMGGAAAQPVAPGMAPLNAPLPQQKPPLQGPNQPPGMIPSLQQPAGGMPMGLLEAGLTPGFGHSDPSPPTIQPAGAPGQPPIPARRPEQQEQPGEFSKMLSAFGPLALEFGLRGMAASQPRPGSLSGPSLGAVIGEAGLGTMQSHRARERYAGRQAAGAAQHAEKMDLERQKIQTNKELKVLAEKNKMTVDNFKADIEVLKAQQGAERNDQGRLEIQLGIADKRAEAVKDFMDGPGLLLREDPEKYQEELDKITKPFDDILGQMGRGTSRTRPTGATPPQAAGTLRRQLPAQQGAVRLPNGQMAVMGADGQWQIQ